MAARVDAFGHTSESAAHVVVCSPVAGDHLSENLSNGIRTVVNASPEGTEKLALKHPRESGIEPPPLHAYEGESVPEAKVTRKPLYSGVVERTSRSRSPPSAVEASANVPSAAALMKPGALREGTSRTWPSITPNPSEPSDHVPDDCPPITGSLSSENANVVPEAPSKVTSETSDAVKLRTADV
eukprot:2907073-Prymnesium_polylepis.1